MDKDHLEYLFLIVKTHQKTVIQMLWGNYVELDPEPLLPLRHTKQTDSSFYPLISQISDD